MACVVLPSGRQVLSAEDFAQWWEDHRELRERGACFVDLLRKEVAQREGLHFRQLRLLRGEEVLGQQDPWLKEPLVAVVQQYVKAKLGPSMKLVQAARTGDHAALSSLLDESYDPDSVDNNMRTALCVAASCGHEEVVHLLLEAGADTKKEDRGGVTPLHAAAQQGHQPVVHQLLEAGRVVRFRQISWNHV